MKEVIFKPKYNFINGYFGMLILVLFGGLFLVLGINKENMLSIFSGVVLLLVGYSELTTHPQRIFLGKDEVVVKRLLLPDVVLLYRNFTEVGHTAIRFGKREIILINMENSSELVSHFSNLINERIIQPSQVTGKLIIGGTLTPKALGYSIIPAFVLFVIVDIVLNKVFDIHVDGKLVWLAAFSLVFLSVYFILKRRAESE